MSRSTARPASLTRVATCPDAIVLDVLLSGIDGWEVLRRLKTDELLRDVPVVIVTVVDEREVGLALGAVDYLVKPVNRASLLDALARYTATTSRSGSIRVLAIDDDPATLDMIEATLRPDGHDVTRATSGQAAIDIARHTPFDLVICDLLMPDLDGFGVVAELGADPRTRDLPILILTAHELTDLERTVLNGKVLGVAAKGETGSEGLRDWLARAVGSAPGQSGDQRKLNDAGPAARILYVEDEELNRALLRAVLGRSPDLRLRSAALVEARTLAQARAILTEKELDIVLLDVRLPDGNGLDLLREIKSRTPDLGVVVMSASVLPEEREEAMKAGSDAFVAKPYVPGDLLATLQRMLPVASATPSRRCR